MGYVPHTVIPAGRGPTDIREPQPTERSESGRVTPHNGRPNHSLASIQHQQSNVTDL